MKFYKNMTSGNNDTSLNDQLHLQTAIFTYKGKATNLNFLQQESDVQAEPSSGTVVNGHSGSSNSKATHVTVSHSRNSSDSSGYHEASVLSESPAEGHQISEKYVSLHNLIILAYLENIRDY